MMMILLIRFVEIFIYFAYRYHPSITEKKTSQLLKKEEPGNFLVRDSGSYPGEMKHISYEVIIIFRHE